MKPKSILPGVLVITGDKPFEPCARGARQSKRQKNTGQSMVEYLILAALAVALIAVPIQGKRSAVELMLDSVQVAYAKFLTALSLPQ